MITSVSDFIAKIGGQHVASDYFGVSVPAIYNWQERGLPLWTHERVRAIARHNDLVLAPELLTAAKPERKAPTPKRKKTNKAA